MEKSSSYYKIRENATKLLETNYKYYMAVVEGRKFILSSSDSKKKVEKEGKEKLLELVKNPENLNGEIVYKVNIRKTSKEEAEDHKTGGISLVGGILVMTIQKFKCEFKNNKLSFNLINKRFALSDKVFLDNKFLKKNIELREKDILILLYRYKTLSLGSSVEVIKASKYLPSNKKIEKN